MATLSTETRVEEIHTYTRYLALRDLFDRISRNSTAGPVNNETHRRLKQELLNAESALLYAL